MTQQVTGAIFDGFDAIGTIGELIETNVKKNNLEISQGDTPEIEIPLVDDTGVPFADFDNINEVIFMAKTNADDLDADAVITLKESDGEIVTNATIKSVTLIFDKDKTSAVTPANYLPFLKILLQTQAEQFHANLSVDGFPWGFLIIKESGVDESIT